MIDDFNPIFNTDSYKRSHFVQYPANTNNVYSYIESRGGDFSATMFFGIQTFLKQYMTKPITTQDVNIAESISRGQGIPFNRSGFDYIVNRHNGYFPVTIRAVAEGTVVPTGNLLVDVKNEDPIVPWTTSFIESKLLRAIWYPTTVATRSAYLRQLIAKYLLKTGSENSILDLDFKLNDFGARGASSAETAMLGGLAHLLSFLGTDNDLALFGALKYYNETEAVGATIPASEHSTMTSWGGRSGEPQAMENMIDQFGKPGAMFACVSDSYDIWNAIDNYWTGSLLEKVKASGSTVVVRPDSGDPITTPMEVIKRIAAKCPDSYVNEKGYLTLPKYFRVIQGDGINLNSIKQILETLDRNKISADNIAFGMGGAMLQEPNRDDLRFAMKCSAINVNGQWRDVFKDPITDKGKSSKRGLLNLVKTNQGFKTTTNNDQSFLDWKDDHVNMMSEVYSGTKVRLDNTFKQVRRNALAQTVEIEYVGK